MSDLHTLPPDICRAVAEGWDGLPVTVDASFTWTNGRIYFFKGSQYWRFTTPGKLGKPPQ